MKHIVSITLLSALLLVLSACAAKAPTLGLHEGKLTACTPDTDCVSSQATDSRYKIEPFKASGDPAVVMLHLEDAVDSIFGSHVLAAEDNYLRAEFRSPVMRTMDDMEFYYDQQAGIIHVRASSRGELFDSNDNRERVETIRAKFESLH